MGWYKLNSLKDSWIWFILWSGVVYKPCRLSLPVWNINPSVSLTCTSLLSCAKPSLPGSPGWDTRGVRRGSHSHRAPGRVSQDQRLRPVGGSPGSLQRSCWTHPEEPGGVAQICSISHQIMLLWSCTSSQKYMCVHLSEHHTQKLIQSDSLHLNDIQKTT